MKVPRPTFIYRIMHVDNLALCLRRGMLHAPKHVPKDGETYRAIHNEEISQRRAVREIPCGPHGVLHDYVCFYLGRRPPMLLQLSSGQVKGYDEGQEPIIYLVSSVQTITKAGLRFVFSDGHGIANFTSWFDDVSKLAEVDWDVMDEVYWNDTIDDPDRQRRRQAEFLVHRKCPWEHIHEIVVIDVKVKKRVNAILAQFDRALHRPVRVEQDWYY